MERSVSGFKERGPWEDIVEHGERVARSLRDAGATAYGHQEALEAFEEWRPKPGDHLDHEISERTATEASVNEGVGEQAGT
ncbi:MAG: DUF5828 family protein, partial [Halobacteriaceae archaeon]